MSRTWSSLWWSCRVFFSNIPNRRNSRRTQLDDPPILNLSSVRPVSRRVHVHATTFEKGINFVRVHGHSTLVLNLVKTELFFENANIELGWHLSNSLINIIDDLKYSFFNAKIKKNFMNEKCFPNFELWNANQFFKRDEQSFQIVGSVRRFQESPRITSMLVTDVWDECWRRNVLVASLKWWWPI